jgi:TRAP-type transport system small permease protein
MIQTGRVFFFRADYYLMAFVRLLLTILLGGMAVIIFANVVLRYSTGGSITWAEELARYAMVWLTFIGVGPILRTGGHIAIENLQDSLPTAVARFFRCLILIGLLASSVGMIYLGLQYMGRSQQQLTASTQIPFAYVYASVVFGGFVMLWSIIAVALPYLKERKFESEPTGTVQI